MASPDENERRLAVNARWTVVAVITTIAASILTTGFFLYLQRPIIPQYPSQLTITEVRFAALTPGEVVFGLDNRGSAYDVTISQVLVQGAGINATASASTSSTIPAGASGFLTVDFSNVTFQIGARYDFTLISSLGNKYPTSAIR